MRIIPAAAWVLPICLGGLLSNASMAEPPGLYGALQTVPQHLPMGREAGWQVALVPVSWGRFEPAPGVFDEKYIEELAEQKDQARKLGYKVQLDLGVQYPPPWVSALRQGRYRNQYGDLFATQQSGADLPNVVFNGEVRARLAAYIDQVFARLGNDWDFVRLGCSRYGELNYPHDKFNGHENCYWAFDDLAQGTASGLPAGMIACPVPGWKPGDPSEQHAAAKKFIDWYLDCLSNYQKWQIATVRRSYAGDICMLYGSWGLRPGWVEKAIDGNLSGATSCERNGEIQQGFDWTRMIGNITDPRMIVYCTWVDGTIRNHEIADDASADPSRWSPVHWQASLASANPLHPRVWGENTGRNTRETMRITFEHIQRFHLMGLMWAFDPELFAKPNPEGYATFADYSGFIRADTQSRAGQ
jgi:hypothetical protein